MTAHEKDTVRLVIDVPVEKSADVFWVIHAMGELLQAVPGARIARIENPLGEDVSPRRRPGTTDPT